MPRLLGISHDKVVLLDSKSKILAGSQPIRELSDWSTGSGKGHDGLILEFRGTKPWTLTTPSVDNLKSVTAALWEAMDIEGRFLDTSTLQKDGLDFGKEFLC